MMTKIGDFVFGTDGKGADNLCVKGLGVRKETDSGKIENLYMNGPEIFTFT
ncbi:MAG: 3-oxoacyl-ACP synthase, partial [Desulfobacterales bacterium]|nr:3-oxoacyl-ACP synthase [Desulfobacterales bacterium]